jgi:hypothetical protein
MEGTCRGPIDVIYQLEGLRRPGNLQDRTPDVLEEILTENLPSLISLESYCYTRPLGDKS